MKRGLLVVVAVLLLAGPAQPRTDGPRPFAEVVVTLDAPPLAQARPGRTTFSRSQRLRLRAPASVSYLDALASQQRRLESRIAGAVPGATVRRRYRIVVNGLAVVLPAAQLRRLALLPGVRAVYPSVRYRALLDRSPQQIGAPALWGAGLDTAGQGMKIAIIDQGIDQTHPFFDPAGYTMPPGFPKGQAAYTTAKVIAARVFAPSGLKTETKPFEPENSEHGTHVAGIAAGNAGTVSGGGGVVSGVAPKAYLGNYKALTVPTASGVGLDGNSPELVAAIEAAVADGMDVINLSLGEAEIEPSRDIVALALDAAADAGVVPVAAAGNEFAEFGGGSISSPGTAAKAITVASVSSSGSSASGVVSGFSAAGPTPLSLRLKPDVSAPGSGILSAITGGGWTRLSGTSMAAPHVAGAVALLRQRHPGWTVAQVKSALAQTGTPAYADDARTREAPATRQGGGVIALARADRPLVFAAPTGLSFGLLRRGESAGHAVELSDAGDGAGDWAVSVESHPAGATVSAPPTVTIPGSLAVTAAVAGNATEGEVTGFVVLTRGGERRRIPYWLLVEAPQLSAAKATVLAAPGLYRGDTRGRPALVERYRYPDGGGSGPALSGPEQVFRVTLGRPVANFGVVITRLGPGAKVEPRIVRAGDENRLLGFTALPFDHNPYLRSFQEPVLAAGAIEPPAGAYDVVFDGARAGSFTFRFWIDDTTRPSVTLLKRTVARGTPLVVRVTDSGSGVYPRSLSIEVDGEERRAKLTSNGTVRLATGGLTRGRHTLLVQVSDVQESRNMENVAAILPNTRILRTSFTVR
ncbi:MAG: S8 family serine peptidase [Actinobacteria bacterium]|nr:S8 family serine peptidase [Actinomycetota bacterium]